MAFMFDTTSSRNQSYEGWSVGSPGASKKPGLINALRRQGRRRFPVRHVLLFLLTVVSFKIFLVLNLGGATYGAKMQELAKGNAVERIAGQAMVLDPVSKWIVGGIRFGTW